MALSTGSCRVFPTGRFQAKPTALSSSNSTLKNSSAACWVCWRAAPVWSAYAAISRMTRRDLTWQISSNTAAGSSRFSPWPRSNSSTPAAAVSAGQSRLESGTSKEPISRKMYTSSQPPSARSSSAPRSPKTPAEGTDRYRGSGPFWARSSGDRGMNTSARTLPHSSAAPTAASSSGARMAGVYLTAGRLCRPLTAARTTQIRFSTGIRSFSGRKPGALFQDTPATDTAQRATAASSSGRFMVTAALSSARTPPTAQPAFLPWAVSKRTPPATVSRQKKMDMEVR